MNTSTWLAWLACFLSGLQGTELPAGGSLGPLPAVEEPFLVIDVGPLGPALEAFSHTRLNGLLQDLAMADFLGTARKRLGAKYQCFCKRLAEWSALGGGNAMGAICTTGSQAIESLRGLHLHALRLMVPDLRKAARGKEMRSGEGLPLIVVLRFAEGEGRDALTRTAAVVRLLGEEGSQGGPRPEPDELRPIDVVSVLDPQTKEPIVEIFLRGDDLVVASGLRHPAADAQALFSETAAPSLSARRRHLATGVPLAFVHVQTVLVREFFSFLSDASKGMGAALMELLGATEARTIDYALGVDGSGLTERWSVQPVRSITATPSPGIVPLPGRDRALLAVELEANPADLQGAFTALLPQGLEASARRMAGACDGGVAFGFWPAPAAVSFPNSLLVARLRDEAAAGVALDEFAGAGPGLIVEKQQVGHQALTTVKLRNHPSPVVPTFALSHGCLFLSDSPVFLAAALRELTVSAEAGPQGPTPAAEVAVGRLSYDTAGLFTLFYDHYLPLVKDELSPQVEPLSDGFVESLLDLDRLPRLGSLIPYMDQGCGLLRRPAPSELVIEQQSSMGGVQNAFVTPLTTIVLANAFGSTLDRLSVALETEVCAERLRIVCGALETYRVSFGGGQRYPGNLAELVERGLITNAATLLVPSDSNPDLVEYLDENGDPQELRVSYRFLPRPSLRLEDKEVLLYEARPGRHGGRFVVFRDGETCHYGESLFRRLIGDK
ncbi:MAG: hypothetical protein AB1486_24980 [Planctomycetota bacterium]